MKITDLKLPKRQSPRFESTSEFVIESEIGSGGFSRVFAAFHKPTQERFALKKIDLSLLSIVNKENIEKELEAHLKMSSPYIIKIIDFFPEGVSTLYLVLEICRKGNLFQHLVSKGPLPDHEVRNIFKQTCLGIAHVHANGYILRDLKPENILLDDSGCIKICDFGWCAALTDTEFRKAKAGTYAYMSPESLRGELQDERTDIWSLGIFLYELYQNKEPFAAGNYRDQLRTILLGPPAFSPQKHTPISAKRLILEILQIDKELRPNMAAILGSQFLREVEAAKVSHTFHTSQDNNKRTVYSVDVKRTAFLSPKDFFEHLREKKTPINSIYHKFGDGATESKTPTTIYQDTPPNKLTSIRFHSPSQANSSIHPSDENSFTMSNKPPSISTISENLYCLNLLHKDELVNGPNPPIPATLQTILLPLQMSSMPSHQSSSIALTKELKEKTSGSGFLSSPDVGKPVFVNYRFNPVQFEQGKSESKLDSSIVESKNKENISKGKVTVVPKISNNLRAIGKEKAFDDFMKKTKLTKTCTEQVDTAEKKFNPKISQTSTTSFPEKAAFQDLSNKTSNKYSVPVENSIPLISSNSKNPNLVLNTSGTSDKKLFLSSPLQQKMTSIQREITYNSNQIPYSPEIKKIQANQSTEATKYAQMTPEQTKNDQKATKNFRNVNEEKAFQENSTFHSPSPIQIQNQNITQVQNQIGFNLNLRSSSSGSSQQIQTPQPPQIQFQQVQKYQQIYNSPCQTNQKSQTSSPVQFVQQSSLQSSPQSLRPPSPQIPQSYQPIHHNFQQDTHFYGHNLQGSPQDKFHKINPLLNSSNRMVFGDQLRLIKGDQASISVSQHKFAQVQSPVQNLNSPLQTSAQHSQIKRIPFLPEPMTIEPPSQQYHLLGPSIYSPPQSPSKRQMTSFENQKKHQPFIPSQPHYQVQSQTSAQAHQGYSNKVVFANQFESKANVLASRDFGSGEKAFAGAKGPIEGYKVSSPQKRGTFGQSFGSPKVKSGMNSPPFEPKQYRYTHTLRGKDENLDFGNFFYDKAGNQMCQTMNGQTGNIGFKMKPTTFTEELRNRKKDQETGVTVRVEGHGFQSTANFF